MLVWYYRLKEKKNMMDLSFIPSGQKLVLLKKEDSKWFVETVELPDSAHNVRKFFWVDESEVELIEKKEEDWSDERKSEIEKILNEKWLEL